jgi:structural maintenance of chromosome 4
VHRTDGTQGHDDGLLGYLEHIIGTATLKAPIETTLDEVERLGEERAVKVTRLRTVEMVKVTLDAEMKDALAQACE